MPGSWPNHTFKAGEEEGSLESQSSSELQWHDLPKLYARSEEEHRLCQCFEILTGQTSTDSELVLVTGKSGSGKSALVERTLRPLAEKHGGYFLPGKFDQLETPENYAPIVSALSHFMGTLKQKGDGLTKARLKQTILECVTTEKLLLNMVPSFGEFVGRPSLTEGVDTKGTGVQNRLQVAFRHFFKALCSSDLPIVLFLDDLQWAEPATLELISALIQDTAIQGLMIVGACRGNEVAFGHHLSVTLRELEANGTIISEVQIGNISTAQIAEIISDLVEQDLENENVQRLANILKERTDGNVFFLLQLLRFMTEQGFLGKGQFSADLCQLEDQRLNVHTPVALLTHKMRSLPESTQTVLKTAACFGNEFDETLLQTVVDDNVQESLALARAKGLVFLHPCSGQWRFCHDQVQQSAYQLIDKDCLEQYHLDLGTKLWELLDMDMLGFYTLTVVNQLRRGARLIQTQDEKDRLAAFLLQASRKAVASANFLTASSYLQLGIGLLGRRHWRDQYPLSLSLFHVASEVEYCKGNFSRMDVLIDQILLHARDLEDRAQALTLRVNALGALGELQKAIDLGVEVLKNLGESFPQNPGAIRIILACAKTRKMLCRFTDEQILNLPAMTDSCKLVALRLMTILFGYALNGRQKLAPLLAMRVVQRTISDGLSAVSSVGFSTYAMLLANAFTQVDDGIRYGEISLQIIKQFQAKEWIPRVYSGVRGFVFPWKSNARDQMKDLLASYRVGLASGDIEFAIMSACLYAAIASQYSCAVERTLSEAEGFLTVINDHQQAGMVPFLLPTLHFSAHMLGSRHQDEPNLNGVRLPSIEDHINIATAERNSTLSAALLESQLRVYSYMRKYQEAETVALAIRVNEGVNTFPPFSKASLHLHMGLVFSILSKEGRPLGRRRRRLAGQSLRVLRSLAAHCPECFQNKVLLVEAELFATDSKTVGALIRYDQAIRLASDAQLWNEKGLACERASLLCESAGDSDEATRYNDMAYEAYRTWGARAKMDQVRGIVQQTAPRMSHRIAMKDIEQAPVSSKIDDTIPHNVALPK